MGEKWMSNDEYILLEGRVWTWVKTPLGPNLTKARVYLTNQRLYGKDALFKIKLFNIPLSNIKNIETTKKHLRIQAEIKGRKHTIELKLKDIDETWEWMIRERLKMSTDRGGNLPYSRN